MEARERGSAVEMVIDPMGLNKISWEKITEDNKGVKDQGRVGSLLSSPGLTLVGLSVFPTPCSSLVERVVEVLTIAL